MKLREIAGTTTAPTKPVTPTPVKPKPKPTFDPFAPPRPKEAPRPKARKKRIAEAFDDEAHQNVVRFWKDIRKQPHPYSKHPIMAMYGHESAQRAFQTSAERVRKTFPGLQAYDMNSIGGGAYQIMHKIMRIESRYAKQLEEIAKDVVSKIWNVPRDILDARLTQNVSLDHNDDEEDEEDVDISEINKRITMNALTQGAAVHNMMTMHRFVESELKALDPQLLEAYDKLSSGTEHTYWLMDYSSLANLAGAAVGTSNVEYDDEDRPTIVAQAMIFPVLIQELVKGVMELLSHHGLSHLSKGQLKKVLRVADKTTDEPWLIQIGPHLWTSFLKIVPEHSRLAETIAKIAKRDPNFIHDLLSRTIEAVHSDSSVENIKEELRELIDEVEEYIEDEEEY
jgi:hypothetical protein